MESRKDIVVGVRQGSKYADDITAEFKNIEDATAFVRTILESVEGSIITLSAKEGQ